MQNGITSLFNDRKVPWDGLGKGVDAALDSATAVIMAELDWKVAQYPVCVNNKPLTDFVANVRSTDGKVLGIVGRDYSVVQNREAFAFTDHLCSNGTIRLEAAGVFQDGRRVWLLARMPGVSILNDSLQPYLVFMNGHDGRNSVRVAITPIRVRCGNMLNLAFRNASRTWAVRHTGNMEEKLQEAARTIHNSQIYLEELQIMAAKLVEVKIDKELAEKLIHETLPLPKDPARQKRKQTLRDELVIRYMDAPDLEDYRGAGWAFVNAVSDLMGHSKPGRPISTFQEKQGSQTNCR